MKRLALALALCAAIPSSASAQSAYFGAGVGPAIQMDDWRNQLRIELEIGAYVDGEPRGFFLSFAPSQSWGNDMWLLVFPLRLGAVVDLFHNEDISVQVGGTGALGLAVSNEFNSTVDADFWFYLSASAVLRLLILEESLALYVRPVGFEFGLSDTTRYGNEAIRFVASAGINYYF